MAKPRKKPNRTIKKKIFIFCEGKNTEPDYLQSYIHEHHQNCTRLAKINRPINIEDTNKNTPVQLVSVAIDFKNKLEHPQDEVWVVYDRESTHKYPDSLHQEAYSEAKNNNIKVALSNICFEYWLLLHLTKASPGMSDCNTLISSRLFKSNFDKIGFKNYSKDSNTSKDAAKFLVKKNYIETAVSNAKEINRQTINSSPHDESKPYRLQPYTDVYKLLNAIDQVAQQTTRT